MMTEINLPLILIAAFIGAASPGPATLAIANTSMNSGRRYGLALASGILTGSFIWSVSAAFGLGALMLANAWAFEVMRYFGACYLLFLAYKSLRSALSPAVQQNSKMGSVSSMRAAYLRGLAIHITNPKAVLFFGSLFSIGVPSGTSPEALVIVIFAVGLQSLLLFHGYALLFSSAVITAGYDKLKRWFEAVFALAFGAAGVKILTTSID